MSNAPFSCPHCGGRFLVDRQHAGPLMACPHCGRRVAVGAISSEAQAAGTEPAAPPVEVPAIAPPPTVPYVPFDFGEQETSAEPQPAKVSPDEFMPRMWRVASAARRRRARRSWIVMLVCLAILAAAVVLAGRF